MTYVPKFRVWHKIDKKMFEVRELGLGPNGVEEVAVLWPILKYPHPQIYGYFPINECELMQWTGLMDKNGKDIYEGDILVYESSGGSLDSIIVERHPDDNQLYARFLYFSDMSFDSLIEIPIESGIILGNIYENPELLEEKND